jgi:hypothetical protein
MWTSHTAQPLYITTRLRSQTNKPDNAGNTEYQLNISDVLTNSDEIQQRSQLVLHKFQSNKHTT